jgi:short-subunit dehydrogenase
MTSPSKVALFGAKSPIATQIIQQSKWDIDTYNRDQLDVLDLSHFQHLSLDSYDLLITLIGCNQAGGVEITKQKSEDVQATMNTNLVGNMMLIQKYMQQRDSGCIIVLTSRSSYRMTKENLTYGISKNCLTNFLDQIRQYYPQYRIVEVAPCAIRHTPFQRKKYQPLIKRQVFSAEEVKKIIQDKWQDDLSYTPVDIAKEIIQTYKNHGQKVVLSKDGAPIVSVKKY